MRNEWQIPLSDGTATLRVVPSRIGANLSVIVDGRDAIRLPRPDGQHPWLEWVLPGPGPEILVALEWRPALPISVMVFIDGRDSEDGVSIEYRRRHSRQPIDRFEEAWSGSFFRTKWGQGVAGALFGVSAAWSGLSSGRTVVMLAAIPLFALGFGWAAAIGRLIEALIARPNWPASLRYAVVLGAGFGFLPAALWAISTLLGH